MLFNTIHLQPRQYFALLVPTSLHFACFKSSISLQLCQGIHFAAPVPGLNLLDQWKAVNSNMTLGLITNYYNGNTLPLLNLTYNIILALCCLCELRFLFFNTLICTACFVQIKHNVNIIKSTILEHLYYSIDIDVIIFIIIIQ